MAGRGGEMPDLTALQREVDRANVQRELTPLRWQKWRYPKSLYHEDGRYRVVFSGEEHAALNIEGWGDEASAGKEYRVWTASEAELRPSECSAETQAAGEADPPAEDQKNLEGGSMQTEAARVSKQLSGFAVCPRIELGGATYKPK